MIYNSLLDEAFQGNVEPTCYHKWTTPCILQVSSSSRSETLQCLSQRCVTFFLASSKSSYIGNGWWPKGLRAVFIDPSEPYHIEFKHITFVVLPGDLFHLHLDFNDGRICNPGKISARLRHDFPTAEVRARCHEAVAKIVQKPVDSRKGYGFSLRELEAVADMATQISRAKNQDLKIRMSASNN